MANYKIIYIDEQEDDRDAFEDFIEQKDTDKLFEVLPLPPVQTLDEMLEIVRTSSADAIISDFNLNEHIRNLGHPVEYDGVELVTSYLEMRDKFPCFVLTSFPSQAAVESSDVNIVYIKNEIRGAKSKDKIDLNFLERVKIQIDHYRARIEEAEGRITELLALRKTGDIDALLEQELIDLDDFLEASIDNRSRKKIPPEFKNLSNSQKLNELFEKVGNLIEKVEKNVSL